MVHGAEGKKREEDRFPEDNISATSAEEPHERDSAPGLKDQFTDIKKLH